MICQQGNTMLKNALQYIEVCIKQGIPGYLENPKSSIMFTVRKFKDLESRGLISFNNCDFCQYGTQWKKKHYFRHMALETKPYAMHFLSGQMFKIRQKTHTTQRVSE